MLVEVIQVSGENHQPVISHYQILLQNVVSNIPQHGGNQTLNSGDIHLLQRQCKPNYRYHTIEAMTAQTLILLFPCQESAMVYIIAIIVKGALVAK